MPSRGCPAAAAAKVVTQAAGVDSARLDGPRSQLVGPGLGAPVESSDLLVVVVEVLLNAWSEGDALRGLGRGLPRSRSESS